MPKQKENIYNKRALNTLSKALNDNRTLLGLYNNDRFKLYFLYLETHNGNIMYRPAFEFKLEQNIAPMSASNSFIFKTMMPWHMVYFMRWNCAGRDRTACSPLLHFRPRKTSRGPESGQTGLVHSITYRYQLLTHKESRVWIRVEEKALYYFVGPSSDLDQPNLSSTDAAVAPACVLLRCWECINFPHDTLPATP